MVVHLERRAEWTRNEPERLLQFIRSGTLSWIGRGVGVRVGGGERGVLIGREVVQRNGFASALGVRQFMIGDGVEPRKKRRLAVELIEPLESAQKRR